MLKDMTGIILCGGKSTRMKQDKALLKLGDRFVIEIVADVMKNVFSEVLLSTNKSEEYSFLNLQVIKDIYKQKGPLSGIHASLVHSPTEKIFLISCDMPLINIEMIKFIADYKSDKKIIIPKSNGRTHQLCGVYSKSLIRDIEEIISASGEVKHYKGSIYELIEKVSAEIVDVESLPFNKENTFLNMNSLEDYELIKMIYQNY